MSNLRYYMSKSLTQNIKLAKKEIAEVGLSEFKSTGVYLGLLNCKN